jgi:hypothetical protein
MSTTSRTITRTAYTHEYYCEGFEVLIPRSKTQSPRLCFNTGFKGFCSIRIDRTEAAYALNKLRKGLASLAKKA